MKKITLLLLLVIIALPSFSQVKIATSESDNDNIVEAIKKEFLDDCIFKVQYRMEFIKNPVKSQNKSNYFMLLQIGKKLSRFSDFFRLKTDSMTDSFAEKKMSFNEAANKILPVYIGTSHLNVFKNYPTTKITVIDRAFLAGNFKYTEDQIKMDWKMQTGTTTVCGYECKKATTRFRGRNYTAWYAPKIAYSDGPWKFSGLPGLILKVTDDKNDYKFECVGIEKARKDEKIYIPSQEFFETSRERFNITAKNATDNPNQLVESLGGTPMPNKKMAYNPIELE